VLFDLAFEATSMTLHGGRDLLWSKIPRYCVALSPGRVEQPRKYASVRRKKEVVTPGRRVVTQGAGYAV
jgi:hypothetical protein